MPCARPSERKAGRRRSRRAATQDAAVAPAPARKYLLGRWYAVYDDAPHILQLYLSNRASPSVHVRWRVPRTHRQEFAVN